MSAVLKEEHSVASTVSLTAALMVERWAASTAQLTVGLLDRCLASLRAARTESMSAVLKDKHSVAWTASMRAASMVECWAASTASPKVEL